MVRPTRKNNDDGSVRFKGVRMRKWGKWVAEVRRPNSRGRIWLGSYDKPEEAARAYDAAAVCLRGPTVALNFPEDPPELELTAGGEMSPVQVQVAASKHARRVAADQKHEEGSNFFIGEEGLGSSNHNATSAHFEFDDVDGFVF